jgi:hypothetical protein
MRSFHLISFSHFQSTQNDLVRLTNIFKLFFILARANQDLIMIYSTWCKQWAILTSCLVIQTIQWRRSSRDDDENSCRAKNCRSSMQKLRKKTRSFVELIRRSRAVRHASTMRNSWINVMWIETSTIWSTSEIKRSSSRSSRNEHVDLCSTRRRCRFRSRSNAKNELVVLNFINRKIQD